MRSEIFKQPDRRRREKDQRARAEKEVAAFLPRGGKERARMRQPIGRQFHDKGFRRLSADARQHRRGKQRRRKSEPVKQQKRQNTRRGK